MYVHRTVSKDFRAPTCSLQNLSKGRRGIALFTSIPHDTTKRFSEASLILKKQMGKSGKKVKSERINAIRKQYDAFLEEDRKRKDRNEYILERLDKMRSCSAMVPVRHTQTIHAFRDLKERINANANQYMGRTGPYEKQSFAFNHVDNSSILTTLKEETLVKELSKKYILIPKDLGTSGYEYKLQTNPSVEDPNDWRSKYSILEELKKSEKENQDISKTVPNNETNLSYKNNKDFAEKIGNDATTINYSQNPKLITKTNDNFQELPNLPQLSLNNEAENVDIEKDLSNITKLSKESSIVEKNADLIEDPKCNNNNIDNDQFGDVLTEKEILQAKHEIESKPEVEDIHTNIERQEQTETLPKSVNNKPEEINELKNEQMQSNINSSDDINLADSFTVHQDNIDIAFKEQNYDLNFENTTVEISDNPHPVTNTIDEVQGLKKDEIYDESHTHPVTNTIDEVQGLKKDEIYDESNVVIDNQEITENINRTVNLDQQYEQHQTNSQEEYVANVDESQIQNFEAEQNNMFYSEQTEDYTYDQSGTGDANIEYTNNESYENNENYAYYEGAAQDQAYSDNINEHEESTELYDPNYQKQYENYEQQDPQPEHIEQYEGTEYDNQQNFDQVPYQDPSYNAVEEIQQQLDTEQGYEEPLKTVEGNLDISSKEAIPENLSAEIEVKNA